MGFQGPLFGLRGLDLQSPKTSTKPETERLKNQARKPDIQSGRFYLVTTAGLYGFTFFSWRLLGFMFQAL